MKKVFLALVAAAAACTAGPASAVEPRAWAFAAPTNPAISKYDAVEWIQGESVRLDYRMPGPLAEGQEARWEICHGTNIWLNAAAETVGPYWSWNLDPHDSALPAGRYSERIAVYGTAGGVTTFHRVAAQQSVRVYQGAATFEEATPVPPTATGLAGQVASNTAAIAGHAADADNPHGVTAAQAGALPATRRPLGTYYLVSDDVIFDGGVSTEGAASVGGDLVVGGSLTVGLGTTTDLSEFATTQTVASVERRVGEVEGMLEEYWCKWTSASLSSNTTHVIPTNWPARTVYCYVYCDLQGVVLAFPDWTPTAPYTLHLIINKTSGGGLTLQTANGGALQTMTSSGGTYRDAVFRFVPSVGWVTTYYTLYSNSQVVTGAERVSISSSLLPEDSTFAPVVESPSLLSTTSLQSPRPSLFVSLESGDGPNDGFDEPADATTDEHEYTE